VGGVGVGCMKGWLAWVIISLLISMPFAQIQYRKIRNTSGDWQQRRSRFLCITISYTSIFLIIGFVFLGLFLNENQAMSQYTCSVCAPYGTPYSCGTQKCCSNSGSGPLS
jgi:hypothetical protein